MAFIIILLAMLVLMYFLLIRPQRAQQRRTQDMLAGLKPGDEIITVGGIYGDVVEIEDDKVVLEIAEDVHIEVARRAIANIVPPPPDEIEEAELEEVDEPESLEPVAGDAAGQEDIIPEPVEEPAGEPPEEKRRGVFGRRGG